MLHLSTELQRRRDSQPRVNWRERAGCCCCSFLFSGTCCCSRTAPGYDRECPKARLHIQRSRTFRKIRRRVQFPRYTYISHRTLSVSNSHLSGGICAALRALISGRIIICLLYSSYIYIHIYPERASVTSRIVVYIYIRVIRVSHPVEIYVRRAYVARAYICTYTALRTWETFVFAQRYRSVAYTLARYARVLFYTPVQTRA